MDGFTILVGIFSFFYTSIFVFTFSWMGQGLKLISGAKDFLPSKVVEVFSFLQKTSIPNPLDIKWCAPKNKVDRTWIWVICIGKTKTTTLFSLPN